MKDSFKDPNLKAALTPYHANAQRSRLPVTFKNEAKPFRRFCQVRNEHTYDFFSSGTEAGFERFRTTTQNYYSYDTGALAVGESNQGIVVRTRGPSPRHLSSPPRSVTVALERPLPPTHPTV